MDFRKSLGTLACILMSTAAISARASDQGFYVGAAVTRVKQDVGNRQGAAFSFPGVLTPPDSIHVDTNKSGWNLTLGYHVNRYFTGEIAYTDFGSANVVETYTPPSGLFFSPSPITIRYSSRVTGPTFSMLGTLPIGASGSIFLRGGVLFAQDKIRQPLGDSSTFGDQVLVEGAGAEWSFNRRWTARFEYQRTGKIESNPISGENRLDQLSLSILFSL